jgi:branched-chain amino acid transport system substrate-binding protein
VRHDVRAALAVMLAAGVLVLPGGGAGATRIKIGLVGPFSGTLASVGERIGNGAHMAIEERNAAGGLLGAPVELVVSDDEGDPQKSTIVAQRLVDDPAVVAVIGPMNSGAVLAAAPIYERAGLAFITPSGTNVRITDSGWKTAFRTTGRDDGEGPAAGRFVAVLVEEHARLATATR